MIDAPKISLDEARAVIYFDTLISAKRTLNSTRVQLSPETLIPARSPGSAARWKGDPPVGLS